jgi:hypothetical protein
MSDPTNSDDPRVENQDGAVRDVDDPDAQQDTVSGGAPDEPASTDDAAASEEEGA